MFRWCQIRQWLLWVGVLMPLVFYGASSLRRPSRANIDSQPLFQGIVYSRRVMDQPRPQIVHIVDIDLTTPGLKPFVPPGYKETAISNPIELKKWESVAKKTSEVIEAEGLQLAINANFFYPFREVALWNYRPRSGQLVNMAGLGISNGKIVSRANDERPALCFVEQRAMIDNAGACPKATQQAVAGNLMLLDQGRLTQNVQNQITNEGDKPYSFTITALNADGTRLWLVLVDGKQPLYSEGMTLAEVTELVQTLGADTALRLDGGGSTTVAISSPQGPQVLNVPMHAKIPRQERPVANHLGFFAQPLTP